MQLVAVVLIRLGQPGIPARGRGIEEGNELFVGINLVADDVDLLDAAGTAFADVEIDGDAASRQLAYFRLNFHRVLAARLILLGKLLHQLLQHLRIVSLSLADAGGG